MGQSCSTYSSSSTCKPIDNKMNSMIFHPQRINIKDVKEQLRGDDKIILLKSSNNTNILTYISKPYSDIKKYIVFAYGNSASVKGFIPYFKYIQNNLGIGYVLFDYQGYGCSEGKPSEQNCYDSIDTVMNFLINSLKIDKSDLYLMGNSLGTGVVINFAYYNDWNTPIILISPYKTIVKVVFDYSFVRPIDKFRTEAKIGKLNCPVKIIHGEKDNLIPIEHSKHLFSKLNIKDLKPKWIKEADHSDIFDYIDILDIHEVLNY